MLHQCHGGSFGDPMATLGRSLEQHSPVLLGRTASYGHNLHLFGTFGSTKERSKSTPTRGGSLDLPVHQGNESLKVNVSGKVFELYRHELEVYPKSLLAKQSRVGKYYDFDKKDYFFDRSRTAFDSIYNFYQRRGALVFPENYPEQLLMDEFYFFGLYDYLNPKDKKFLVKPSQLAKEVSNVAPKREWQIFLWHLLEHPDQSLASKIFSIMTLTLIAFSIIIMCLDTIPALGSSQRPSLPLENSNHSSSYPSKPAHKTMRDELFAMETFCIVYFTLEIVVRFIVSPSKLRFWLNGLNIIDVIAILPYYIILTLEEGYSGTVIVALRMFRLFRAFRILKVSRYISGMQVLGQTLREAFSDLWMIAFLTVIGTLLFASCVFYFENIWDPGTPFESIPLTLWWSIVTISTIGYGDMAPKTLAGKLVGSMCAISGVLLIAPLLPIVYERWQRYYQLDQVGKKIKAGQNLLREIEKRRLAKASKKDKKKSRSQRSKSERAKKNDELKEKEAIALEKKRLSMEQENKEIEMLKDGEVKPGDDAVWTHIKRASLKRRESRENMMKGDGKNASLRGARRSESSRKGKDIVKGPIIVESPPPPDSAALEDGSPVFTFSNEETFDRDWSQPGPSNVIY